MDNESRPHFKPGAVKYTKGYGFRLFISKLTRFIILITALIAIGGTIYIYINQPVKTANGYITATPAHKMLKPGEFVTIVEDDNYGMFTPLKRFAIDQTIYNAEVVAGPYGEIKKSGDRLVVVYADQTIGVNLEIPADDPYLDEEYIVRKVDNEGKYIDTELDIIVIKEEVLGYSK